MLGNWIKATTTTTGTGNLTLAAVTGYPTPANEFAVGQLFSYSLLDSNGAPLEAGYGYMSDATTLVRSKVTATFSGTTYSQITPTAVTLSGTTTVICAALASLVPSAMPSIDAVSSGVGRFIAHAYSSNLQANYTLGVTSTFYIPFMLATGAPISSMAINVVTAVASSTVVLGIYQCNDKGYPGQLLASTGSIDTSTTGFKNASLGTTVALPPGWYYVALYSVSAITVTGVDTSTYNMRISSPTGMIGNSFTPYYLRFGGTGLPSTAPLSTTGSGNNHPFILLGLA